MTISNQDRNNFTNEPDKYLLRIDKNNHITAQAKGIFTSFASAYAAPDDFKLTRIVQAVWDRINSEETEEQSDPEEAQFLAALNKKIADYNKNPDHEVELKNFTEEIEKRNHRRRIEQPCDLLHKESEEDKTHATNAFVRDCVLNHLQPYLTAEITPETEDKEREPLTDSILEKLQEKFPKKRFNEDIVREVVFNNYVQIAVTNYISTLRLNKLSEGKLANFPDIEELKPLIKILEEAIKIDFSEAQDAINRKFITNAIEQAYAQEKQERNFPTRPKE